MQNVKSGGKSGSGKGSSGSRPVASFDETYTPPKPTKGVKK